MARAHSFAELDEQPFKRFHWLALFTTGMGVFTDGYDLASIVLVLPAVLACAMPSGTCQPGVIPT